MRSFCKKGIEVLNYMHLGVVGFLLGTGNNTIVLLIFQIQQHFIDADSIFNIYLCPSLPSHKCSESVIYQTTALKHV